MPIRIPWDRYEVALLFQAYEKVANGADMNAEAAILSDTLRKLAVDRGITIDDTYRNINGMKMQLRNIQYLFTNGKKGLSSSSTLIRDMFRIYMYENAEYQAVLKDAIQLLGKDTSVENAFFNYAQKRTRLSSAELTALLKIATDYCRLKQPILGMTDVRAVRNIQQNIFNGKLLRYKYGNDAQAIRNAIKLYYAFIKSYRKSKEERTLHRTGAQIDNHATDDLKWQAILKECFPDGYILDDFLCQLQAAGFWEERYKKASPLSGSEIDTVMTALGNVRDGRAYAKNDEDGKLFETICEQISEILNEYTAVYRNSIYEHYESQLSKFSIYTEPVMSQQLLSYAKGRFYETGSVFARQGKEISLNEDCRKVLRNNGGAMSVDAISKELWFIPYDTIYHNLVIDEDALNLGNSVWMLAEHFPLTEEDAVKVGDMLDECFISRNFVKQTELLPLLRQHLPSLADNLSGLHSIAIFNILNYYLKNRFSFSKALIAPKGAKQDFRDLFRQFAKEHDRFTLEELSVFAGDLNVPIYWENTYNGGAVRVSKNDFVNRRMISFDIENIDIALSNFCTDDYLPFQEVTSSMMMHLPACGYQWNGYLLLSYVHGFSKKFHAYYNSLGKTGYYGAMVKQCCKDIISYEDLIERILTRDDTWATEDDALALLVKKGIQAFQRD